MKILFLVTEGNSANGICCKAIMKQFALMNDKVFAITNQEADNKQEAFVEDGLTFFTVRPRTIYAINSYILNNRKRKPLLCSFLSRFNFLINKIKLILSYPTWPLVSPLYVRRMYKKAKDILQKENIDCIVPVYSQVDTLIVAHKLKKENQQLIYIPYFLDSFSGGYGPKMFSREWIFKRGLKWERRLLDNADKIIMMESARSHYDNKCKEEAYYKKIKYLDLPLYESREEYVNQKSDMTTILYAGTLPNGVRSPLFFLDAFTKINDEKLRLVFVGDESSQDLKRFCEIDKRITCRGRCSHAEVLQLEKNADVLLNIGNTLTNMTPSKIFEYLSWNKPIISTLPIANEPSAIYLKKFPLSLLLNEFEISSDEAARLIEQFISENKGKSVPQEFLNNTYINNMPKSFVDTVRI